MSVYTQNGLQKALVRGLGEERGAKYANNLIKHIGMSSQPMGMITVGAGAGLAGGVLGGGLGAIGGSVYGGASRDDWTGNIGMGSAIGAGLGLVGGGGFGAYFAHRVKPKVSQLVAKQLADDFEDLTTYNLSFADADYNVPAWTEKFARKWHAGHANLTHSYTDPIFVGE